MQNCHRKPCPYCGTPRPLLATVDSYWVMCGKCFMSGPKAQSPRAANIKWNNLPRTKRARQGKAA